MQTSIRVSSRRRICRSGLVAVLPLSVIILAATAANVPNFIDLKGSFKGKASLFSGGLSVPGKATASIAARKQGKEGKLKWSCQLSINGGTLATRREIDLKGRKIKTRTQFLAGGLAATGRGNGKFRFRNSKFTYDENSTLSANGMTIGLTIKGTARFTRRKAQITEVWTATTTPNPLTFKLSLRRK